MPRRCLHGNGARVTGRPPLEGIDMKIRSIRLRGFKRFTETDVVDIPITARLVVLAGPNGCGKSSLMDAVHFWYRNHLARAHVFEVNYHRKDVPGAPTEWPHLVTITFHDPQPAT